MKNKQFKLLLVVLLSSISIVYIITLTNLNIRHFEETIDRQARKYLLTVARSQTSFYEDAFNDIIVGLQRSGRIISKNFSSHDREVLNGQFKRNISVMHENIQENIQHKITQLCWIDSGCIVRSISTDCNLFVEGMDLSIHEGIKSAIEHSIPSAGTACLVNDVRVISFNVPIVINNKVAGVLKAVISLEDLKEIIRKDSIKFSGYTWMTDSRGTILIHPDKTLLGRSVFAMRLRQFGDEEQEDQIVRKMLDGMEGAASYVSDIKNKSKSTVAWSSIQVLNQQWPLAVYMDYDKEISLPMKMHSQNTFIMMACFILSFGAAGVFYFKVEKKKTENIAHQAINRINDQLHQISEERHQSEIDYKSKIHELEHIISSIPYGVFWKNRKSVYQGCNQYFAKMAGLHSSSGIYGKTDSDLNWLSIHADYFKKCDRDIVKTGIPLLNIELQGRDEKSAMLFSEIPLRNVKGKIFGVLGVLTDITNLKRDQEMQLKYHTRQLSMINEQSDPVLAIDCNDMIVYANRSYCNMFKKETEDIIHTPVSGVVETFVSEKIRRFASDEGSGSKMVPESEIHSVGNKDYLLRIKPVLRDGYYDGMILSWTDVDSLTRDKENYENDYKNMENSVKSLSSRIWNSLTGISGLAEKLLLDEIEASHLEHVKTISQYVQDAMEVINEMPGIDKENLDVDSQDIIGLQARDSIESGQLNGSDNERLEENICEAGENIDQEYNGRILVVDDVCENRMLIKAMLKSENYHITQCKNGKEAVDVAGRQDFDVILMDIQMPVMDGKEATYKIRSGLKNKNTPIIALTASISSIDEMSCLEAGCDGIIKKPLKKEHLVRKVWRCVEQTKQIKKALSGGDVVSFLSNDPDYTKTIEMFIDNLSDRISEMKDMVDNGDMEELSKKAHAMKGLGGFAGFPVYTEKAKELQVLIAENDIDKVRDKISELVDLCKRTKSVKR